jgi:hypothetical protein
MDQVTTGTGMPANQPPPGPPAAPPVAPPPGPPAAPSPAAPVAPPPVAPPPVALSPGAPPAGEHPHETHAEHEGHRGVALLLGAVAILAAIVGARSTALASSAGDAWQSALRTEVRRSTGALEDIRYVYQTEVPVAVVVIGGRLKEDELRKAAAQATGPAAASLSMEADIANGVVTAIEGSAPLVTDPAYALPNGGVDLGQRLADQRNELPGEVALDPDALQEEGDHLGAKASSMTIALLPLGLAALFGAMAQPFGRARRLLLGAGASALGIGAAIAILVEVMG